MSKPTDFAYHLTNYLSKYLPGEIGASKNTILSYRDTFSLLLRYAKSEAGVKEEKLTLKQIDKAFIIRFLTWIEDERHCSVSTRNQRLAAIHAFFSYLQPVAPEILFQIQDILSISVKKHHQLAMNYLSEEGVKVLLAEPNRSIKTGRKHLVLLSFLFETGCRVQELVDVIVADVMYNANTVVKLTGKGNKSRFVPLGASFVMLMKQYIEEFGLYSPEKSMEPLFASHTGCKYTRQGISHVVAKYAALARTKHPHLIPERLSPHSIRHSRAVFLLRSGVDLIYIRDILGHVSIQTTEIYVRIDGEMKRKALKKAAEISSSDTMPMWQKDKPLFEWLKSLG